MRRFSDLPLVWKLLLPLIGGTLVVGALGSFLVVRTLSSQAQTRLDEELFRQAVVADARIRDHIVELVEAVRLGANIKGVPDALERRQATRLRNLVAAVPATHRQLDLLVVTDRAGTGLVTIRRTAGRVVLGGGGDWKRSAVIARARAAGADPPADKHVGLERVGGEDLLVVAAPVRGSGVVGAVLGGIRMQTVAERSATDISGPVSFFRSGELLGASGVALPPPGDVVTSDRAQRHVITVDGRRLAVSYSSVVVNGEPLATLAVGTPTSPAYASVRAARDRLLLLLVVAIFGLAVAGAGMTHLMLRQVRPLVALNRALGRGELSARAPVLARDELGELAAGLNQMAEQLQAAHLEAENRVLTRTEELERLYRELAEVSKERSETFALLNHEFRNDLAAVAGLAEIMTHPRFDDTVPGWRQEYGQIIGASVQAALGRVTESLDLARRQDARIDLVRDDDARIGHLLEELRPTVLALASRADLDVRWAVDPELPPLSADRRRLREVVMNLISNAVKYTPTGGRVQVTATSDPTSIEVSVSDTGIGIPDAELDRIFEPFYRTSGTSPQHGEASSGLGLAHVRRIIDAHNGTIDVVSEPGAGSTFTVRLPRTPATPGAQARSARRKQASA